MPFEQEKIIDFLGRGLTYPIELNNGRAITKTGKPLIESSMKIIASWPWGTRIMLGEFGSKLNTILEEPNTLILERLISAHFRDSMVQWEKRVEFISIEFHENSPTKKTVRVFYRIINSQQVETFIFPFYKNIDY